VLNSALDSQLGAMDALNEANQPPETSKPLDVLFWIVDVASFGSFLRYLHRLEEVRDTLLTDDKWRDHIWRLVKEWEEFNLIVGLVHPSTTTTLTNFGFSQLYFCRKHSFHSHANKIFTVVQCVCRHSFPGQYRRHPAYRDIDLHPGVFRRHHDWAVLHYDVSTSCPKLPGVD
jgi:hypothetical protein